MRSISEHLQGEVILYDLEYTAWPGSRETRWSRPGEHREIVEMGARRIRIDNGSLVILAGFSVLVKPTRNPKLSDYFTQLTGITQADLEKDARTFADTWREFCRFSHGARVLLSFGEDDEIIRENLALNGLPPPDAGLRWFNYRTLICNELSINHQTCSADLPTALGLPAPARQHRALDDVDAQLIAISHLLARRATAQLTP